MPVVASYPTEILFAGYLLEVLGDTAAVLGWTTPTPLQPAVDETMYALGLATIADATDIRALRTVGRRELWRQVANATAGYHQFTADGASYALQQIHEQAVARLALAEIECGALGVDALNMTVRIDTLSYANEDPYAYRPWLVTTP